MTCSITRPARTTRSITGVRRELRSTRVRGKAADGIAPDGGGSERSLSKALLVQGCDLLALDDVILATTRGDLHRPEERGEPPGALPVPTIGDPVEKPRAIRVAATGWIDQSGWLHRRNLQHGPTDMDERALSSARDDQRLDPLRDRFDREPGALGEQAALIVVDRDVVGALDHLDELGSGE